MAVPMVNPVAGPGYASDAGGWFPQIFASEGTVVDITLKTSAGVTVQSYVDVTFVGSDTGEFERTLADSTRFKIRGSGSVVYIEFGDPSPDNTGGTAVIGGWAGTQADLLTVNAVLFNVVGQIKENGKKLPGVVYTDKTDFTAATTVDINLTNDPAGVTAWDIDVWGMSQSAGDDLWLRMNFGAGFRTGVADYAWLRGYSGSTSGPTGGSDISDDHIQLMSGTAGAANTPASFRIRIYTPNSGNNKTTASWAGEGINSTEFYKVSGMGYGPASAGRCTQVRLLLSSTANMTGSYRVVPVRGTGDA